MARVFTIVAVGLIVLGGVAMAGPSFGFSTIAGDRVTSVSTAENDAALIALVDESPDEFPNNDFVTAATLENNVGGDMDVTYNLSVDNDEVEIRFDDDEGAKLSGTVTIESDSPEEIELNCGAPGQRDSDVVTLTASIDEATSTGVTISDAEMKLTFNCEEGETEGGSGEDLTFDQLDAEADDGPSEVTFTYELSEEADDQEVDITFSVVYGSNNNQEDVSEVTYESGQDEVTVELSNTPQSDFPLEVTGSIDGGEECTSDIEEANQNVSVC